MKDKLSAWFEANTNSIVFIVMSILLVVDSICLLLVYTTGQNMIFIGAIIAGIETILFSAGKSYISPEKNKIFSLIFKASLALIILILVATPFSKIAQIMRAANKPAIEMTIVSIIFSIIAAVFIVIYDRSYKGKERFEKFCKIVSNNEEENAPIKSGDIILCKDKKKIKEKLFPLESDKDFDETCADADKVNKLNELIKEKKTDINEILPYKDRFLHMLILGPTGSGKTSQILLPLVYQDIQNLECGVTVLEPKGDFAQKAAMMAKMVGRPFTYFDPSLKDCPHFNPMCGKESDVVENMATTFRMLNPDSPTFFLDLSEQLMRNAVKVLKRLDKDEGVDGHWATLINLSRLLQNSGGQGREIVSKLMKVSSATPEEAKENADIISWFQNDYFAEKSKVYENTSGVRSQVAKITSNEYLRDVLNPDPTKGQKNDIDFDKHLAEGGVICISTAQGSLRDLGRFLGYFIILQLQSAVFRRPGNEDTRRPHFLYIDEFQTYSNPGFADMLTQGRSYRVASHLATQARSQMAMGGGKDGKNFVELVSTNARNIILFPGCNTDDAKYYSDQFGEYEKTEKMVGISRKRFNVITGGLDRLGHPTESIRYQKKETAVFSASDLIYRPFGQIVYCIIKKNSIQIPKVGMISYIPKDVNEQLDKMMAEYLEEHRRSDASIIEPNDDTPLIFDDDVSIPKEDALAANNPLLFNENGSVGNPFDPAQNHDKQKEEDPHPLEKLDDDYGDPFDGMM